MRHLDAFNERAERQEQIERRLVGQLGDRYKDARLIEVSEGSYLIKNIIKLAVLGKNVRPLKRSKDSITKKAYLRGLRNIQDNRKYVLAKAPGREEVGIETSKVQIGDSVGHLNTQQLPQQSIDNYNSRGGIPPRTNVDTFDSESDQVRKDFGIKPPAKMPNQTSAGIVSYNSGYPVDT